MALRSALLASTALFAVGLASPVYAQVVWDGDTDTNFTNGPNWVGDAAPTAVQTAQIDNGATPNAPTLAAAVTVDQLVLSANTLTLNATLTATTQATQSGTGVLSGTGTLLTPTYTFTGGSVTAGVSVSGTHNLAPAAGDHLIAGNLVGAGAALNKSGDGIVRLSGNNTFTGAVNITAGTLAVLAESAIPDAAAVNIGVNGTLRLDANQTIGSLNNIAGAGGVVNLQANRLTVSSGDFGGALNGAGGGLTKETAGSLTLTNPTSNYSGSTLVNAGQIIYAGGRAENSAVVIANGARILSDGANDITIGSLAGVAGSGVDLAGRTLFVGADGTNTTFAGNIFASTGGVTKGGLGTLTLSGANFYTGTTAINAGILEVQGGSALVDTSTVSLNGTGQLRLGSNEAIGRLVSASATSVVSLGANTLIMGADGAPNATFNGGINGTGGLFKVGNNVQILSGNNTFTGPVDITNGTLAVAADSAIADTTAVNVGVNGTLRLDADQTIGSLNNIAGAGGVVNLQANRLTVGSGDFGGALIGAGGGLTKETAGVLRLTNGTSSYSGSTLVNAGQITYAGGRAENSAVVIANGARIASDGANDITIGSLAGVAGSGVDLAGRTLFVGADGTNTNFAGSIFASTGGVTKGGLGTLTLSGANFYTGTTAINAGVLAVQGGSAIVDSGTVVLNGSGEFRLGSNEAIGRLVSASGTSTVGLGANTLIVGLNGAPDADFAGQVTGTGSLLKVGTNVQILSGNNSYTGSTQINAGVLRVVGNAAIPDAGDVTVGAGGTLDLTTNQTIGTLSGVAGSVVSLNANTLTVGRAGAPLTTFSGQITGTGGITKITNSVMVLDGTASTYSGSTTINGGILRVGGGSAIPDASAVAIGAAGTLDLTANETIGDLSGTGQVTLNANTLTVSNSSPAISLFSGNVVGPAGTLVKTGTGTLVLSGNNTQGITRVNNGTLQLDSEGAIPDATGGLFVQNTGTVVLGTNQTLLTLSDGGLPGGVVNLQANRLTFSNGAFSGQITGSGGITKESAGVSILSSNTSNYTGETRINDGQLLIAGARGIGEQSGVVIGATGLLSSNGTVDLTIGSLAGVAGSRVDLAGRTLFVGANGTSTTFAGQIIASTGALQKNGLGTLTLSGTNLYTGGTSVSGGVLAVQNGAALVDTGTVTLSGTATLRLLSNETIGQLAGVAGTTVDLNANTLTVGTDGGATTEFAGLITGAGGFTKQGNSVQIISGGANNFGGDLTVNAGTLRIVGGSAVPNTALVNVNNAGILDMTASETIGALAGPNVAAQVTLAAGTTLTLNGNVAGTYAGGITGAASTALVKNGGSTQTLSGNNNAFLGGVTVNAGLLSLQNGNALADTAAITLNGAGNRLELLSSETVGTVVGVGGIQLNANTLTMGGTNASFTYDGIATGAGGLTKVGTGTLTLTGANSFTGPMTVNGGTVILQGGSALGNATPLTVGAAGTVQVTANETVGTVNNSGVIDIRSGLANPNRVFTVTGDYNGSAGATDQILVSINRTGPGVGTSDRMVVQGNVGANPTNIAFTDVGGIGLIDPTTVVTVNGVNNDTAFTASGLTGNVLVNYALQRAGANWNVVSTVSPDAALAGATASQVVTAISSGFTEAASAFVSQPADPKANQLSFGIWSRGKLGQFDIDTTSQVTGLTGSSRWKSNLSGFQVGADGSISDISGSGYNLHFGLTAGNVVINSRDARSVNFSAANAEAPFLGAYAALTGNGMFADLQVLRSYYDIKINNPNSGFVNQGVRGNGYSVNGSVGRQFVIGETSFIEPAIGFNYSRVSINRFALAAVPGAVITTNDLESMLVNARVRFGTAFQVSDTLVLQPSVTASIWHEFAGDSTGTFSLGGTSTGITTDRVGTFGQIGLGVTAQSLNSGLLGFVRADYRVGEKTTGYSINAGVRYQF